MFFNFTPNLFKICRKTCFRERSIILNFISLVYTLFLWIIICRNHCFFLPSNRINHAKNLLTNFSHLPRQLPQSIVQLSTNTKAQVGTASSLSFFLLLLLCKFVLNFVLVHCCLVNCTKGWITDVVGYEHLSWVL